jgi:hypothetical protein
MGPGRILAFLPFLAAQKQGALSTGAAIGCGPAAERINACLRVMASLTGFSIFQNR